MYNCNPLKRQAALRIGVYSLIPRDATVQRVNRCFIKITLSLEERHRKTIVDTKIFTILGKTIPKIHTKITETKKKSIHNDKSLFLINSKTLLKAGKIMINTICYLELQILCV